MQWFSSLRSSRQFILQLWMGVLGRPGRGEDLQGRPGSPPIRTLRAEYGSFAELEVACVEFGETVNVRPRQITRRPPARMLAGERAHLHPVARIRRGSRSGLSAGVTR